MTGVLYVVSTDTGDDTNLKRGYNKSMEVLLRTCCFRCYLSVKYAWLSFESKIDAFAN